MSMESAIKNEPSPKLISLVLLIMSVEMFYLPMKGYLMLGLFKLFPFLNFFVVPPYSTLLYHPNP